MTSKVMTQEFVIPTMLAIALDVTVSISAVCLIDNYFSSTDDAEVYDLTGPVKPG